MARASASRGKRARPDARKKPKDARGSEHVASRATSSQRRPEDLLFFTRLRRRARWIFLLLALVFAVGFLAFGVGAGGTGIGDAIQGLFGGDGGTSVEDAQSRVDDNPGDPEALLELSRALQEAGRTTEAIDVLAEYTEIVPDDPDVLRELATLYLLTAQETQREASALLADADQFSFGTTVYILPGSSGFVDSLGQNPIEEALSGQSRAAAEELNLEVDRLFAELVPVYEQLAALDPTDPTVYLELAQAADAAGDTDAAIAALETFLELAPDDPNAPLVRQQLEILRGAGDIVRG